MKVFLHNSLTKKKELFVPAQKNIVKIYVCGVTVYDLCHLGHARGAINFDVLKKLFQTLGYQVIFVKNYTDIDDKIIAESNKLNIPIQELTEKMIAEHDRDMASLFVSPTDIAPKATENVTEMIAMIKELVEKGYAYESGGDVFFRVSRFAEYGKLSGKKIKELQAGARVEINEAKENALDFVLWKASKENEPAWDSIWGAGRPGWHIECSCMCNKFIEGDLDIHGGGADLIFPHHENEIAQSESLFKKKLANYWMHNGMIQIEGKKMSKSLGNFATIRELTATFEPEVIRFFILQSHYRQEVVFSHEALKQAHTTLDVLYFSLLLFYEEYETDFKTLQKIAGEVEITEFLEKLADDLNSPLAIAKLLEWSKELNKSIKDKNKAENLVKKILQASRILGLANHHPQDWKFKSTEVIKYCNMEIENNPNNEKFFCNRGKAKKNLAEYEKAVEDYDRAIEINPDNANAFNNRGIAKGMLGKYAAASEDFEKAIKIKPTFVEAIRNRDIAKDMGRHYQEKKETGSQISPAEIQKQIEARDKARQEKNWQAADNIRKDLQSKGVKLKDSEGKTHWYRSS